jgi:hypothetical protein
MEQVQVGAAGGHWDRRGTAQAGEGSLGAEASGAVSGGALPVLNDGGSFVLTGSVARAKGAQAFPVYGASKAAIRNFVRGWIVELQFGPGGSARFHRGRQPGYGVPAAVGAPACRTQPGRQTTVRLARATV